MEAQPLLCVLFCLVVVLRFGLCLFVPSIVIVAVFLTNIIYSPFSSCYFFHSLLNVPLQGCWLFKKNKTMGYKCFFARVEGSGKDSELNLYHVESASEIEEEDGRWTSLYPVIKWLGGGFR